MKELSINLKVHDIPVNLQPFYAKNYTFAAGDFPVAEKQAKEILSLPVNQSLLEKDLKRIIGLINYFQDKH